MTNTVPLEYGKYYHIYNRGVNGEKLFYHSDNYKLFLKHYDIYIDPIAETFAWCLMGNHFHLLVRIKEQHEIGFLNPKYRSSHDRMIKWKIYFPGNNNSDFILKKWKRPIPERQFGHLFDSYAKIINQTYKRTGNLFERPFERIAIESERYFCSLIRYIHLNPVHHGFVKNTIEYPWTSYLTVLSQKNTKLYRHKVIEWFDNTINFESCHKIITNYDDILNYLIE